MNTFKAFFIVSLSIGLSGCGILQQTNSGPPAASRKVFDAATFQHAAVSGEPLPFSSLTNGEIPEAVRCEPIWDKNPGNLSDRSALRKETQDIILYIVRHTNDYHQTLLEYSYEDKSTGETWQDYYINKQLVYQGTPQFESDFYPRWAGRSQLLFRAENGSGFFFLLDTDSKTIRLFNDCRWKSIPMDDETVTNDIWNYYDPSMEVQLGGYDEVTGRILFYLAHEHTTLFEYTPLWPNRVTILLDNLPTQDSGLLSYIRSGNLVTRNDGTLWFSVEADSQPDWSNMVFKYDTKSGILSPAFSCTGKQDFYFHKETITIHGADGSLSVFDYNTSTVYPLENCSGMYVNTEIGPNRLECIQTYSETQKKLYLWDTAGFRRYYIDYDTIVSSYPGASRMIEGDQITYLHGSGRFFTYREPDSPSETYRIDWYSSILHPSG